MTCEAHATQQGDTLEATAKHRRGNGEETTAVALLMTYLCLVLQTIVASLLSYICLARHQQGKRETHARLTRGTREVLARHTRDKGK